MINIKKQVIIDDIEKTREMLIKLSKEKENQEMVLKVSQKLDELLNKYYKLKRNE